MKNNLQVIKILNRLINEDVMSKDADLMDILAVYADEIDELYEKSIPSTQPNIFPIWPSFPVQPYQSPNIPPVWNPDIYCGDGTAPIVPNPDYLL